ncbi:uncharacterized protein LOC135145962 [Zophobas morio]|jgi:hypothetical protein|uniref:uncharacterized protein LOC135145962 n=1 Tax=Zophobas morio TaxID=2755281 RepID=UPI0030838E4B
MHFAKRETNQSLDAGILYRNSEYGLLPESTALPSWADTQNSFFKTEVNSNINTPELSPGFISQQDSYNNVFLSDNATNMTELARLPDQLVENEVYNPFTRNILTVPYNFKVDSLQSSPVDKVSSLENLNASEISKSVDDHFRRALRRVSSESNIAKEEQWTDYRFDAKVNDEKGDYKGLQENTVVDADSRPLRVRNLPASFFRPKTIACHVGKMDSLRLNVQPRFPSLSEPGEEYTPPINLQSDLASLKPVGITSTLFSSSTNLRHQIWNELESLKVLYAQTSSEIYHQQQSCGSANSQLYGQLQFICERHRSLMQLFNGCSAEQQAEIPSDGLRMPTSNLNPLSTARNWSGSPRFAIPSTQSHRQSPVSLESLWGHSPSSSPLTPSPRGAGINTLNVLSTGPDGSAGATTDGYLPREL